VELDIDEMDSEEKNKIPADKPQNSEVEIRLARYTGWLVAATIALGLFTALLAYIGFRQICVSEKSFKDQSATNGKMIDRMDSQVFIARETMRKGLRAYLAVDYDEAYTKNDSNFDFRIRNDGQTPAHDVQGWAKYGTNPYPQPKILKGRDLGDDKIKITKGFSGYVNKDGGFISYPERIIDRMAPRNFTDSAIYFWGELHYRDIFDGYDTVRFCYMTGGPYTPGMIGNGQFGNASK
jgi:hypothetical protein